MVLDASIITWLIGHLIVGAAIYGGIRADIRGLHQRQEHTEKSVTEAHVRIDRVLERRTPS